MDKSKTTKGGTYLIFERDQYDTYKYAEYLSKNGWKILTFSGIHPVHVRLDHGVKGKHVWLGGSGKPTKVTRYKKVHYIAMDKKLEYIQPEIDKFIKETKGKKAVFLFDYIGHRENYPDAIEEVQKIGEKIKESKEDCMLVVEIRPSGRTFYELTNEQMKDLKNKFKIIEC